MATEVISAKMSSFLRGQDYIWIEIILNESVLSKLIDKACHMLMQIINVFI